MAARVPVIAIVGRPNVGKSTLFNRIVGEKKAVVEDREGVTRDRNYAFVVDYDFPFHLVDTGGIEIDESRELAGEVKEQAVLAIEEADLVLALFDGDAPVHPDDEAVVKLLRKHDKPVIYIVNKCDGKEQVIKTAEYYCLGLDELIDISALHGHGVLSLMGEALSRLPDSELLAASAESRRKHEEELLSKVEELEPLDIEEEEEPEPSRPVKKKRSFAFISEESERAEIEHSFAPVFDPESNEDEGEYGKANRLRDHKFSVIDGGKSDQVPDSSEEESEAVELENIAVAIVGRPNVGKSTFLNLLAGEERAITSPISGTTRDSLDLEMTRDGQKFTFIDTAGLRRKSKIFDEVERYATMRALSSISACDVAVLVIDAEEGPTEQDATILGLAHDQGRGVVIAVNKWDLLEKNHKTVKEYTQKLRVAFKFAQYAPIVFMSALSGRRCPKVVQAVKEVAEAREQRVPTRRLNRVVERAVATKSMPSYRGRRLKLYYVTQVETCPPRFVLFLNHPKGLHFSYLRYLKNAIRGEFEYPGTDIKLMTRKRSGTNG